MRSIQRSLNQITWILNWSAVLGLLTDGPAHSQIQSDRTLLNPSVVTSRENRIEITGGTQSGRNLFHSFRDFSVPNRNTASFQQIDPGVENIFSRITGSSVSRVDGRIETLNQDGSVSSANLFLMNPNGIIFGPKASLNIGGSFVAMTANSIRFSDGARFSAVTPQANPLLTVSVPIGLQFGRNSGRIINRSETPFNTSNPLLDSAGNPLPAPFNDLDTNPFEGLRVAPNQTIALLGSNIQFPRGELTAPGGHIEVSSLAGSGLVRLIQTPQGLRFGYAEQQQFGNIWLSVAELDVSGEGSGSVQLQGNQIYVEVGGIRAATRNQNGRAITIQATNLTIDDAVVSTESYGLGQGGNVQVSANQLALRNGGQIAANTYAGGQGGNIFVRVSESIEVRDVVRLRNEEPDLSNGPIPSGLFASVCQPAIDCSRATAQGGNISVVTDNFRLLDGGQATSNTYGVGDAGSITVRASNVEIVGTVLDASGNSITNRQGRTAPSTLSTIAEIGTRGDSGRIEIETDRLTVRDGATLQSSTLGSGNAGDLTIRASDSVELSGVGAGTEVPAGLFSFSGGIPETQFELNRNATGRAGNLQVTTPSLMIRDAAVLAVGSANPNLDEQGRAGNLQITADRIQADDQARLLANTNSGRGGNVNLQISGLLLLNRNSEISTTAGSERQGGDGGNITLDAGLLIGSPATNNDITANAFTGNGGDILISTQGIVGLAPTDTLTPRNDPGNNITASSALGVDGEISISSLGVDPTRGLQLPESPIDEPLLVQDCLPSIASQERSSFVVVGRGGLPPSPYESLAEEALWQDWRLGEVMSGETGSRSATGTAAPAAPEIVEAQGWVQNSAGQVELVAMAAPASSPALVRSGCTVSSQAGLAP